MLLLMAFKILKNVNALNCLYNREKANLGLCRFAM